MPLVEAWNKADVGVQHILAPVSATVVIRGCILHAKVDITVEPL